jgi:hypothetical protein
VTRSGRPLFVLLGASALAAALLIFRYGSYPSASDSWAYLFYAFRFRMDGVLHDLGTIRTYGYPLLLMPLTYLAGFDHARLSALAGVVQYMIYAAACLWLAASLRVLSSRWAWAALLALLLGPVGLALVTDALTEAPSLIIAVVLSAMAVRLGWRYAAGRSEGLILAGGALAGFALMVRPANLPLVLGWHAAMLAALLLVPSWREHRPRLAAAALGGLLMGALSWLPQAIYAMRVAGEASILPICRLGGFQVTFGVLAWKYDTVMGQGAGPWYTPNPLFSGHLNSGDGWGWYLQHPLRGTATMLAHLILSFDVGSPFVYIYDRLAWYRHGLRIFYWAAVVLAGFRLAQLSRAAIHGGFRQPQAAVVTFLLVSCAGTMAINAISAVETRFNALPLAVATILATEVLLAALSGGLGWNRWKWSGALVALILLVGLSYAAEATGRSSLPPGSTFTLPSDARCTLTLEEESRGQAAVIREYEEKLSRQRGKAPH